MRRAVAPEGQNTRAGCIDRPLVVVGGEWDGDIDGLSARRAQATESDGGVIQMSGRRWLAIGMVALWPMLPASAALAAHSGNWHVVARVSVATDGNEADGFSGGPAVSGNGRIVAFTSDADNLVPGDSNDTEDVFVRNRATGRTERVSVASDGSQANDFSFSPVVSGDGRIVAFESDAGNLVPGDDNNSFDVFVHDRATGRTKRVSVASDGSQANGESSAAAVSGDGRIVAFWSSADNLVAGDNNGIVDVFVHDRATGRTERVSVASDGSQANGFRLEPAALNADGSIVAFASAADNLVPGDSNDTEDVFVHDRTTGRTERVSVANDGSQANADSIEPVITGGGRIVAFSSRAANLVPGDSNGTFDVFVHNRATERTERVSVASDGSQGNDHSNRPTVSGDGRVVAFESLADDLVAADSNSSGDAFVHNRATGRTELVSVARDGSQASGPSLGPEISRDGRVVTFQDTANDLVAGDSNGNYDVFVAKRTSPAGCTITGSGGDDVLIGTAGDDVLCGMGGHDRLIGRGGDDRLRGGLGADRLRGGRGADRLRGERGPDRLYGGPGPDRLYGGPGDDRLRGGPGRDRLRGGPGDDRLRGRLG